MKYNYPVKYAAKPIMEPVGWGYENEYEVVCYIVSKCYLLSDKIKYKENGKKENEYEVVFPYQMREYTYDWEKVRPSSTNSEIIKEVFDNYEEALESVTQKNKLLCRKTCTYIPLKDIPKKIEEFNERLSQYKILEQKFLMITSDLEQSHVKELNNLIIKTKGKIKVVSSNLYDYLWYSRSNSSLKFIAYSISLKQYDRLITLINNKDVSDILKVIENASPMLYHDCDTKEKNIMVIDQNGNVLYSIDEWETLKSNNEEKIPPVELNSIDDETIRLFTTETFEDIVLSFNNKYINPDEIQGPVLKKTRFDKNK